MVGSHQVVINGFGHANDTDLVIVVSGVIRELQNGVHRIVAADVEEVADIVLLEDTKYLGKGVGILDMVLQLPAAGSECGGGGAFKGVNFLFGIKNPEKVDKILLKEALDTVFHTVEGFDDTRFMCLDSTADNTRKGGVNGGGGAARLSNDSVSVKN